MPRRDPRTLLTTREATRRVGRDVRTIRRWRAEGMPVTIERGRMLVELETLLAWYRKKTRANPVRRPR